VSGLSLTIHQSTLATRIWALVPGIRELVLLALVVVALYGRTNQVRQSRFFAPLSRLVRPSGRGRRWPVFSQWLVDRWLLVLAVLAGVGVLAWVATSFRVVQAWAGR